MQVVLYRTSCCSGTGRASVLYTKSYAGMREPPFRIELG
jgi:hypothetical protein